MSEILVVQPKPPLEALPIDESVSVESTFASPEKASEKTVAFTAPDVDGVEMLAMAMAGAEDDLAKIHGIEEKLGIKLPQAVGEKEETITSFGAVFDDMTGKISLSGEAVGNAVVFKFLQDIGEVNAIADTDSLYDEFIIQHPKEAQQYKNQYYGIAAAFKRKEALSKDTATEIPMEAPIVSLPDGKIVAPETIPESESDPVAQATAAEMLKPVIDSPESNGKTRQEDAKHQEGSGREVRLLEGVNLNTEKILKHAENLQMSLRFLDRAIDDMKSSRSGFNIGKKLEESSLFTEIKQQARRLADGASSMKRLPPYADGEDALMKQSVDMLSRGIGERQAEIWMLTKRMDEFYRGVSVLQKKITDFYDGKSNTDEDALRNFQGQIRSTFENLKDLDRLYRNQELMLADLRQDKPI